MQKLILNPWNLKTNNTLEKIHADTQSFMQSILCYEDLGIFSSLNRSYNANLYFFNGQEDRVNKQIIYIFDRLNLLLQHSKSYMELNRIAAINKNSEYEGKRLTTFPRMELMIGLTKFEEIFNNHFKIDNDFKYVLKSFDSKFDFENKSKNYGLLLAAYKYSTNEIIFNEFSNLEENEILIKYSKEELYELLIIILLDLSKIVFWKWSNKISFVDYKSIEKSSQTDYNFVIDKCAEMISNSYKIFELILKKKEI
jgi:hypothetical protein